MRWTGTVLAAATGGRLIRASARPVSSVFIDSRSPLADALFVPIVAARDGHAFVTDAIRGGASAVLIGRGRVPPDGDVTVVEVADTLAALSALARHARDAIGGPVVAVTGSNGKTTTRALVQAGLETAFSRVLCTRGNLNNHLGVPLTLLGPPHEPEAAVVEIGTSAPGEVDALAAIVRPTIAVITSVALEHVQTLHDLDTIARAEFEVAAHVQADGALVLPSDEPRLHALVDDEVRRRCRVWTFGPDTAADVRILDVRVDVETIARVSVRGRTLSLRVRSFGAHNVLNAAAALCVALHADLDPARVAAEFERVEPVGDRGRVIRWGEHLVVADCYNANPGSMQAAMGSLAQLRHTRPGPLVAVIGDMLELGPHAADLHSELGSLAAEAGLDALLGFGALSEHAVEQARRSGLESEWVGEDVDAAVQWVRARMRGRPPGAVLVKASRGIALERVVERLLASGQQLPGT